MSTTLTRDELREIFCKEETYLMNRVNEVKSLNVETEQFEKDLNKEVDTMLQALRKRLNKK